MDWSTNVIDLTYLQEQEQLELPVSTPYEVVTKNYTLPFENGLYPFQRDIVNYLAPLNRAGYWMDVGTGKTATSVVSTLYKLITDSVDQGMVIMPPILIDGWYRFLSQIRGVSALMYRGSPAERRAMKLNAEFILLGYEIFKNDYERLRDDLGHRRLVVVSDEAQKIKNTTTQNHKKFRDFTAEQQIMLLSGTPISQPIDGYAMVKLVAPSIYRSKAHFERIHVASRDYFGNVERWQNLDLLAENMKVNSVRVLKEDVLHDLPQMTYTVLPYQLSKEHMKLYRKLAEEQLLELDTGGKIDATQESALYHALQQIVLNLEHFSGKEGARPAGFDLIDQVLDELGGRKLVIFGNYKMTNRSLSKYLARYNAVTVFGDNSVTQNRRNIDLFVDRDDVKVAILQPESGGVGVDGLQSVCSDALFIETPTVPRQFHQAAARLHRSGQRWAVNTRIAIAEGTCQVRLHRNLLDNDSLVNRVVPGPMDLRDAIYGR